ncbi:hypothetical protein ACFV9D_03400 [Streptomyces sp. NPDC059875]|uniref:hypothetical protein n=1 Tax=unclassified Streptomyces TaxID=2593676 RepID=UPI003663C998
MSIKAFLRDYAAPAAKDHRLVRAGSDFKVTSSSGNTAILFFEELRIDSHKVVFGVSYCIIPAVFWAWVSRYDGESVRPVDRTGAFITRFILPPDELSYDSEDDGYLRRMWSYGVGAERECGSVLRECLSREVIPEMVRLLDRELLLAELLEPTRPGVSALSQDLCEILLGMDSMTSAELEERLAEAERNGAFGPLVDWVRQRFRADSK